MVKETREYYCDLCKKQMSAEFGSLHFYMPLRDYMGNTCTGLDKLYRDICEECCKKLNDFICGLDKVGGLNEIRNI